MVKSLGVLFALLLAVQVRADDIKLGEPAYGGTGCPGGSASVALSPDQKAISILFDSYVAEAGGATMFDRKNCNIAVPIHVPQGFSVSVMAIDYRGFVGLPAGARSQLAVNYFLAGAGYGINTQKSFVGPISTDYLKSDNLGIEALVWTPCGANTILRANTTLLVTSNAQREEAMGTVDSADIRAGLIYHLQWRRCQ